MTQEDLKDKIGEGMQLLVEIRYAIQDTENGGEAVDRLYDILDAVLNSLED